MISNKQTSFNRYNQLIIQWIMTELSVFLRHAKRSNRKQLDLSKRQLNFIPKDVFTIRTLEQLNLSDNKLTNIEPAISELFRLKVLNLQKNALSELPEEIQQLPKLSVLSLKGNPLNAKFKILLETKFNDNLQDILHELFETGAALKITGTSKKTETPSWLMEPEQKNAANQEKEKEIAWDSSIFRQEKPSTASKTFYGRRPNKEVAVQVEPERQAINGVLVLRPTDLQIEEQISMGGFSTIHRGRYFQLQVAIKKVFNPNISEQLLAQFNNEVGMLAKYRHPNIVLMIGAITTPPQLLLVMELVPGTLYDLLHRRKAVLNDGDKKRIAIQLVSVISYLHRHGIVHRDIKSHNVLIDKNYNIKMCDFGLARHKSQLNSGPMQFSGTPTYMAQEMFQKRAYNESVDVFALGTLLYELYAGEVPYQGLDPADIKDRILKDSSLPFKVNVKKSISEIINRCRASQSEERPSSSELAKFSDW